MLISDCIQINCALFASLDSVFENKSNEVKHTQKHSKNNLTLISKNVSLIFAYLLGTE